jgi:hypothetical protein
MIEDRPILTLADLEAFDPRAPARGKERRFCCPLPACQGKRLDGTHRSLSVNVESGAWRGWRCQGAGKLQERWEPRERLSSRNRARRAFGLMSPARAAHAVAVEVMPVATATEEIVKTPKWRTMWNKAPLVAGTPGEHYLQARGITVDVARKAGVRYVDRWPHWVKDNTGEWQLDGTSRRVMFPIVDQAGELVGIQGRAIDAAHHGEKVVTRGSGGVFCSTGTFADASVSQHVVIVEAPIDALSLAKAGVRPVLATCGTSVPDWLPRALAFKQVALGHDNDEPDQAGERPGDAAALKAAPVFRSFGAIVERWRPALKDWNDVLMRYGSEVLRRELGDDQVDDVDATDVVREVQGRLPREDVAVRQASNPASIEIRDPFTDEWIEIDATICPESWRRQAELEVTRRNERQGLWKPP